MEPDEHVFLFKTMKGNVGSVEAWLGTQDGFNFHLTCMERGGHQVLWSYRMQPEEGARLVPAVKWLNHGTRKQELREAVKALLNACSMWTDYDSVLKHAFIGD
jgi:hypothetical protein